MGYLEPGEYVAYGLTAETPDDWVAMASALIEAHCRRPSLLVTAYVERVRLVAGNRTMRLSYGPVSAVTGVRVRYGQARRGEIQASWLSQVTMAFGLPGSWSVLDLSLVDLDVSTGEVTLGWHVLGLDYNEVEVSYNAGVSVVPVGVKVACAQVVKNAQAMPALNVSRTRMDTMQMQYFSGSLLDESVKSLLRPYVATKVA
ncbi:hypothetical protein SAMN05421771_0725 [Granulicella pectinivorans]|jgi:hypothetical protein|uniref:Uncharacterized protein n=1 Tax=Granulicella pectinivorans TaxID=474950 RepID=A0A1I6LHJ7_9BACT|nr:hypothetical protein [Granulicella pectinivorans]SFS02929.1 hypothetical protein SAMN05421771_0725 [Granulicella pectinivorans]